MSDDAKFALAMAAAVGCLVFAVVLLLLAPMTTTWTVTTTVCATDAQGVYKCTTSESD